MIVFIIREFGEGSDDIGCYGLGIIGRGVNGREGVGMTREKSDRKEKGSCGSCYDWNGGAHGCFRFQTYTPQLNNNQPTAKKQKRKSDSRQNDL